MTFDLDLGVKVIQNAQYPLHHVTYAAVKFEVATPKGLEDMHLQENTLFDLLTLKVTCIVAQYPLHHVTYAAAKLEVATLNGLGENAFTRKYII